MSNVLVSPALRKDPFPHTLGLGLLTRELCDATLEWLENGAHWKLRIADFYEQWELHLDESSAPEHLEALCSAKTINRLAKEVLGPLGTSILELTEITAHKLVPGQTIKIHNDFLPNRETHRVLVQLNRGWHDEQGGLLMLFGSGSPEDLRRVVRPHHGSHLGFGITPRSYHAVSTVKDGERYTLVYSFKAKPAEKE